MCIVLIKRELHSELEPFLRYSLTVSVTVFHGPLPVFRFYQNLNLENLSVDQIGAIRKIELSPYPTFFFLPFFLRGGKKIPYTYTYIDIE